MEKTYETYTKQFQDDIIREGGWILSDGTLNLRHLLPKAYDICERYALNVELQEEILNVFNVQYKEDEEPMHIESLFMKQYYGEAEIPDEKQEESSYIWNETVFNFFNEIAPEGFYFGSSEGDGACIGWFKVDDSLEDN